MKLIIATPIGVLLNTKIKKVTFETAAGYYTLLPKHVDFVASLTTGIAVYVPENESEKYAACHQGIVIKKGDVVTFSVQRAILGPSLSELQDLIKEEFKQNEEKRKELNTAMARLELGIIRGFRQLRGAIDG